MAGVRPLRRGDLPRLTDMHLQGFPGDRSRDAVESFLGRVMFDHPWLDDRMPSLGYESAQGELIGCIGVMPRPMTMNGRPLKVAISNNFIVDPAGQPGIAAFALVRSLRSSGADLILGEANATARDICERLGWSTVRERSYRWLRPLRPAALGVGLVGRGWLAPRAGRMVQRVCRFPDALITKVPGSPLRVHAPAVDDVLLEGPRLLELLTNACDGFTIRPCYDERSLDWLLTTLRGTRRTQVLRGGVVPAADGATAGWYLYYSRPGGIGRVLQLGAGERHRNRVLQHLFHDAWRNGNNALSGQGDPVWIADLEATSCFFYRGSSFLIAHAPDPATLAALSGKDAFLSRLETEAWITFAY